MSEESLKAAETFLTALGKTLAKVHLYSLNHPMVKESVRASHEDLQKALSGKAELTVASAEDKIVLDGIPLAGAGSVQSTFLSLFEKYRIQSLTFKKDVSEQELVSFYKLLTLKQEAAHDLDAVKSFLERENVTHILLDVAFFAKVSGKQSPADESAAGAGAASPGRASSDVSNLAEKMQAMSLESALWEVIRKAVPDPEEQKRIYAIIFKQIQSELDERVEKATSQLKKEKQEISNEKARAEAVINNIAEGTIIVDESGRIVMLNPAAERIYGATLSELKGKRILETTKDELMITLAREISNSSDENFSKDVAVQSSDATQQALRTSTAMIQNPEGKIVGIMSILNDIAKQRELQRMQNDFMANVTHELRSPLTAIKASLSTFSDDPGFVLNPQQQNILGIANRNVDRLARLINDLLDTTKIDAGKMPVHLKPVETPALLQDAAASLQSWAQNKGVSISVEAPGTLPRVSADYDRVMQVLVNLLSNAIKFTPKDGSVKLKAQPMGALYLKIMVADSGPGIAPQEREKLFQRFHQLKQTEKSDAPGTGLGLYIAKTIVELHNGVIGVDSEPGKGSVFHFTLPVLQETPRPAAAQASQLQTKVPEKKKGWFSKLFGG